jgi:hypothetical protein
MKALCVALLVALNVSAGLKEAKATYEAKKRALVKEYVQSLKREKVVAMALLRGGSYLFQLRVRRRSRNDQAQGRRLRVMDKAEGRLQGSVQVTYTRHRRGSHQKNSLEFHGTPRQTGYLAYSNDIGVIPEAISRPTR